MNVQTIITNTHGNVLTKLDGVLNVKPGDVMHGDNSVRPVIAVENIFDIKRNTAGVRVTLGDPVPEQDCLTPKHYLDWQTIQSCIEIAKQENKSLYELRVMLLQKL